MLSFSCDYLEGAHEAILSRLAQTNYEQLIPYGEDVYTVSAKEKIRVVCQAPDAQIFFLTGGTQTNQTVIDALLASYEGVVAADSGHIGVHEAGAIEFTGHKVLPLPNKDGKLPAETLERYLRQFYDDANHTHMVFPGLVYLSHPTEYGTLYTAQELQQLCSLCDSYGLRLYIDGARLGYGLAAENTDVTLPLLARYCDAFSIGGTKVGALCGEAVVFPRRAPAQFMTVVKQHGALMAKGRLLGIQFDTLFTDELYLRIGKQAVQLAAALKAALRERGYTLWNDSPTNQIFVVLENGKMRALRQRVSFDFWEVCDAAHTVVRFATSWATTPQAVEQLILLL